MASVRCTYLRKLRQSLSCELCLPKAAEADKHPLRHLCRVLLLGPTQAIGLKRIVRESGALWAGGTTRRSEWVRLLERYRAECAVLNEAKEEAGNETTSIRA